MVHDLTSLTIVLFLFFLLVYQKLWKYFGKKARREIMHKVFRMRPGYSPAMVTFGMFLVTSVFLFLWFSVFGFKALSAVGAILERLVRLFSGIAEISYMPRAVYYPTILTPVWATLLLRLRDILTYAPVFFGFLLVLFRSPKSHPESFVIGSSLAFGLLFLLNDFLFNIEAFRTFMLASPFVALLGAVFLVDVAKRTKRVGKTLFIAVILMILVFSSFVGLWGHNFAPLHIYDPSKQSIEIGERNTDFMRVSDFFEQRVPINEYQVILVDDDPSLVHLLQPDDYVKIRRFDPSMPTHSLANMTTNELACELKDLNLYSYYSGPASQIKDPLDAMAFRSELIEYLANSFNRMYDDGKYGFWVSEVN
jgi:hypothetical protein